MFESEIQRVAAYRARIRAMISAAAELDVDPPADVAVLEGRIERLRDVVRLAKALEYRRAHNGWSRAKSQRTDKDEQEALGRYLRMPIRSIDAADNVLRELGIHNPEADG